MCVYMCMYACMSVCLCGCLLFFPFVCYEKVKNHPANVKYIQAYAELLSNMIQYLHLPSPCHALGLHRYSSHRAEPLELLINAERFATVLAGKRYSKETPVPRPLPIRPLRQ